MKVSLALSALLVLAAAPAWAERSFEGCSKQQVKLADEALTGALELARRASASVGDTPDFERWFGAWTPGRAEEVRANLKAVHAEIMADEIKTVCLTPSDADCKQGTYAYVMFDRPRTVHVCPSFFAMPDMADARAGVGNQGDGTREGTMIHEISHFPYVARTDDHCYSRMDCESMARGQPDLVIENADSYQYYSEDATLTWYEVYGSEVE
jgi:peptidyl-Lys metalloendopeptidase